MVRLRQTRPGTQIPYFDPTEAGVNASILLLLEAPGPKTDADRGGSGFVSADNDDSSAENLWHALRDAGVDRGREIATWNIVPWYIGTGKRIRPATPADIEDATAPFRELQSLLKNLRVVVLLGKTAFIGWSRMGIDLPTIACPHPSPQNLNTRPLLRTELRSALVKARSLAEPDIATGR